MIKIILISLFLFALFAFSNATSICDTYTPSNGTNKEFMTGFISAVVGAVAGDGTPTQAYFDGTIGTDSDGNTHDFLTNTTALGTLITNLVEFFGGALGCSDGSIAAYTGPEMDVVHKNNMIDKVAFEYFDQQVVMIAQVAGVSHDDQVTIAGALESFRGDICTQSNCFQSPYTITVGQGGKFFNPPGGYSFPAGSSITFVWYDTTLAHSATQNDGTDANECSALSGGFDAGVHTAPFNFTQTFNTAGTYGFFCDVGTHCSADNMYGSLVITGQSPATTSASTGTTVTTKHSSASTIVVSAFVALLFLFF